MMDDEAFDQWAIVELFGHVRRAGHLSEQEIAGHGFLRLEIPSGDAMVTQLISPKAVYAITPTTEDIARAAARNCQPQPVHRWELEPGATLTAEDYSFGEAP